MKILAIAITIFAAGLSNAMENLSNEMYFASDPQGQHIFIKYNENNSYFIDHFLIPPNEMQKLVSRQKTKLPEKADALFIQLKSKYDLQPLDSPQGFLSTEVLSEKLWEAENQWSEEWENKFNQFVNEEFDENFFVTYNIATDCADAAIALRWIFARKHKLPMGIRLAGSETLITHESMRRDWMRFPRGNEWHQDKMFLRAIDYIMNMTYTHSLSMDSYPVKMNAQALRAGTFLLSLGTHSGHTENVSETNYDNISKAPIILLSSTIPREVRPLFRGIFFYGHQPASNKSGFRSIRWLEKIRGHWRLKSKSQHLRYSEEQFDPEFLGEDEHFAMAVFKRVAPDFTPSVIYDSNISDLAEYIKARIPVVTEGFEICKTIDCSPGTQGWEAWSTPSRDKRMNEKIAAVQFVTNQFGSAQYDENRTIFDKWQEDYYSYTFDINGRSVKLSLILGIWNNSFYSSDPRVSIDRRWAATPEAVYFNARDDIQKMIDQRTVKINRGSGRIEPNSEEYLKRETYSEDQKLNSVKNNLSNYCAILGTPNCQFPEQDDERFQIQRNNQRVPLALVLKEIPWYISEPNLSLEHRWGKHLQQIRHFDLGSFSNFYIDEFGHLWNNEALVDLKSFSTIADFSQCIRRYPLIPTQRALCVVPASPFQLKIHLHNNQWVQFDPEEIENYNFSRWINKNFIVLSKTSDTEQAKVKVFQISNDSLSQVLELNTGHWRLEKNRIIQQLDSKVYFYSFSDNEFVKHEITALPNDFDLSIYTTHEMDENLYFIRGRIGESPLKVYFLTENFQLKKVLESPSMFALVLMDGGYAHTYDENNQRIYRFSENGLGRNILNFSSTFIFQSDGENLYGLKFTPPAYEYYRIRNDFAEKFAPRSNRVVLSASMNWITEGSIDGSFSRLITFDREEIIEGNIFENIKKCSYPNCFQPKTAMNVYQEYLKDIGHAGTNYRKIIYQRMTNGSSIPIMTKYEPFLLNFPDFGNQVKYGSVIFSGTNSYTWLAPNN